MNHESVMCARYVLSGGYDIGYQKLQFTGFEILHQFSVILPKFEKSSNMDINEEK